MSKCLVCGEALEKSWVVACARCQTRHHRDCFRYNGACAIYACGETRFVDPRAPAAAGPVRAVLRQARLEKGAEPRTQVVVDFESGAERACVAVAVLGVAIAALVPLFDEGFLRMQDHPAVWMGFAIAAAGVVARSLIDDVLVVDPATRSVDVQRRLLWFRRRRALHEFDDLRGVSVDWCDDTYGAQNTPFTRRWLVLIYENGRRVRLGDVHGTPGYDADTDLQRQGSRIANAMGVPLQRGKVLYLEPAMSFGQQHGMRAVLWGLATLACARWGTQFALRHPGLWWLPVAGSLVGLFLAHWWLLARPLGTLGQSPRLALETLAGLYDSKRKSVSGALAMALALTGIGVVLSVWGSNALFDSYRIARFFKPVECRIVSSRTVYHAGKSKSFGAAIEFAYSVGRREFRGDWFGYSQREVECSSKRGAEAVCARFPPDSRCTAWYDPEDPAVAYLSNESATPSGALLALAGLCLLAAGLAFFSRWITISAAGF